MQEFSLWLLPILDGSELSDSPLHLTEERGQGYTALSKKEAVVIVSSIYTIQKLLSMWTDLYTQLIGKPESVPKLEI